MRLNTLAQLCAGYLIVAALLSARPASAAPAEVLKLRQVWAPNLLNSPDCAIGSCDEKLKYGAFIIGDLSLSDAAAGCPGPAFDASQIPQDVQTELLCVLSPSRGAWQDLWNSAGRCTGLNVSAYFTLMAASFNLFNANGPLAQAAPAVAVPFSDRDAMVGALRAAWGVAPGLDCDTSASKALVSVSLCLDSAAATAGVVLQVDCPGGDGGAACAGALYLAQGDTPPDSCATYLPASLDGAYLPSRSPGSAPGGTVSGATGAAAAAGGGLNETMDTGAAAALTAPPPAGGQPEQTPAEGVSSGGGGIGGGGGSGAPVAALAPVASLVPIPATAALVPASPPAAKPALPAAEALAPQPEAAAPLQPPAWTGPLPQQATLNPGSAAAANGADFLLAMSKGVGDIALSGDIAFTPADFRFQSYSLPINVSGAMRVHAADPATPVTVDWSGVSGLINVYQDSALILDGIVSQNVGDGRAAIVDRTVRVQVVGSPLWPTVTGADGHQVLFQDCYLVVPDPTLFPQAQPANVLANDSSPLPDGVDSGGPGGSGMRYGNLTVVTPSLILVDLTQAEGLLGAANSYTAGKALYSLIDTTADTVPPSPPPAPAPAPEPDAGGSSGLGTGAVVGVAVGVVAVTAAALAACCVWRRRRAGCASRVADPVAGPKPGPKGQLSGSSADDGSDKPSSGNSTPLGKAASLAKGLSGGLPAPLTEVVVAKAGSGGSERRQEATAAGGKSAAGAAAATAGIAGRVFERQASGDGSSPGTAQSVLPGVKNPFLSNTTRGPSGVAGNEGDDLFLSYIRSRIPHEAHAPSPLGATPAPAAANGFVRQTSLPPLSRDSSLTPSIRRAALSSSESSLWDIPFEQITLLGKVGEGAFGRVYRGEWHATTVAVKLLLPQAQLQDEGSIAEALTKPSPVLARLQEEADLMFSLRHPNCVQLMGTCLAPPCLITEFCARGSLADVLREARRDGEVAAALSWQRRVTMALDAAKGMLYLHSHQPPIVHRDLKSPNLLVDKDWNVKVADFNLSKILGEDHSGSQEVTNPRWLAPEVLQGDLATPPSDVFGFGVVLWELMTFQIPWCHSAVPVNPWQLARMVLSGARLPVPPAELLPGPDSLRPDLLDKYGDLMQRCWDVSPAERPTFAAIAAGLREMLEELERPGAPC